MKFQVPQFIEIEDKIFGPLTLKQFIYLAGGAGLSYIIYATLYIYLALPIIAVVVTFSLALAFYKINNKPFILILESAVKYALGNKLYIWKKVDRKVISEKNKETSQASVFIPKLSDSKLKDLTWSLDINEIATPGAKEMYQEYKKNKV